MKAGTSNQSYSGQGCILVTTKVVPKKGWSGLKTLDCVFSKHLIFHQGPSLLKQNQEPILGLTFPPGPKTNKNPDWRERQKSPANSQRRQLFMLPGSQADFSQSPRNWLGKYQENFIFPLILSKSFVTIPNCFGLQCLGENTYTLWTETTQRV